MLGWNEFAFFESTPIKDPHVNQPLYSDTNVLSFSPSSYGTVFISTRLGYVKEFNQELELLKEFKVCNEYKTVDFVRSVTDTKFVVTFSSQLGVPLEVSLWDLNFEKAKLHSQFNVSVDTNTFPLTCVQLNKDASVLVLGFADGSVVAVRGDLQHDKGTKQRQIYKSHTSITGLSLSEDSNSVFVASIGQIAVLSTTSSKSVKILDKTKGADLRCTDTALNSEFLVARDSDIAFFNIHHRGPSFEFDVVKKCVYLTKSNKYLVLVASFPSKNSLLTSGSRRLLILDLEHHLVAFNDYLVADVKAIFEQWGQINVITTDGTLHSLTEKDLRHRVSALESRNLYQIAISVASNNNEMVLQLHQNFADYLFNKNDIEGALKEYIAAIDLGQSSRAIRRFKDTQHVSVLLKYLIALYKRGRSTAQHVTLQVICYTKLNMLSELELFLKECDTSENFDFEQVIGILTETQNAQYAKLAAFLAEKWPDPDLVVHITLRILNDARGTLDYIQTVSVADALRLLIQNSTLLLNKLPVETTGVLITLFTGKFIPKERTANSLALTPMSSPESATPVLQSYQAFIKFLSSGSYLGSQTISAETLEQEISEPSYLPPRPRLIFPSFINHDNEFVIFLEACLQVAVNLHSSEKDLSDIATTLFETYIRVGLENSASELLSTHAKELYPTRILLASEIHEFPLTVDQRVALGISYADIFRDMVEHEKFDEAINVLMNNYTKDKDMVLQSVTLLTSSLSALNYLRKTDRLTEVLLIAVEAGASHVQLISELSNSHHLVVKDLEPFIYKFIKETREKTERHIKLAESYEAEINEKIKGQKDANGVIVLKYDECMQCHQQIDLPAVHFKCGHSYHQQCIDSSNPSGCPNCRLETEMVETIRSETAEVAAQEEYFLEELSKGEDKMKVIMDFISRGALSEIR